MTDQTKDFGATAASLARNPLGIIALFIVLVYGFASLVAIFGGSFTPSERVPLIYFLILFPIVVLAVFSWLVSKHSGKLFAPSDFKDESNYVKMQLTAVASLAAASAKGEKVTSGSELRDIVEAVNKASPKTVEQSGSWRKQILWVDDLPTNNNYEREAFEAIGLRFTLALSTKEALTHLESRDFALVISDMGRKEGPREGYVLLDAMRAKGDVTPLIFYASSREPEHVREAIAHGGQGCTNNPTELFELVTKHIIKRID